MGSIDYTRLLNRLDPPPDGELPVRHRSGVVSAVNADGTVDVNISGVVVPDVAVLDGVIVGVTDVVQVAAWAGDLLVLGRPRDDRFSREPPICGEDADNSTIAINTVNTTLAQVVLTIPSRWTSGYRVRAWWQVGVIDSSGGAGVTNVITVTAVSQSQNLLYPVIWEFSSNSDRDTDARSGFAWNDETAVGSRTFSLLATRSGDPTCNAVRVTFGVEARRTS